MSTWALTQSGQFVLMDEPGGVHAVVTPIAKPRVPYDAYELEFTVRGQRPRLVYRPTFEDAMHEGERRAESVRYSPVQTPAKGVR